MTDTRNRNNKMQEPRFQTAEGRPTTDRDNNRMVWYSARCAYWTDDWTKTSRSGIIPVCPICGCPGLQATYEKFVGCSKNMEYTFWLKEKCLVDRTPEQAFQEYLESPTR